MFPVSSAPAFSAIGNIALMTRECSSVLTTGGLNPPVTSIASAGADLALKRLVAGF